MSEAQQPSDLQQPIVPDQPAVELDQGEMTPEQLAEAQQYGRLELACGLLDRAVDLAYMTLMALLLARPLDYWLQNFAPLAERPMLRVLGLFLIVYLLHALVSLPLSYYSGFVLEHRFGLSRLKFSGWVVRYLKYNVLGLGFGAAMMVGLYWVIWTTGSWWWLVAAFAAFVVSAIIGRLLPVLIIPLFYKVERYEDAELSPRLHNLAAGTGLRIEGIYRLNLSQETVKANAMLTGLGRTRRVLLGDTLLSNFSPEEIEVIFGHEVGHHVFRHIPKLIAFGAVYSLVGFFLADRVLMSYVHRFDPTLSQHELPVWTLPLLMLVITVFSLVMEPLQNALSRRFERQCDRYALERTGLRGAYQSAFRKLAKLNKDDPSPHPIEVFLFHSHPPIAERLAVADEAPQGS